jgi:hypothetical protein
LLGSLVLVKDPYSNKKYHRYISGVPGVWIKNPNTGIYLRIPEGHIWVESLNIDDISNSSVEWGYVRINYELFSI